MMKKFFARTYLALILVLLYAPIILISVFSFTDSRILGNWTGFSLDLYANLFHGLGTGSSLVNAIYNTFLIAVISSLVAMVLGTVSAIGIFHLKGGKRRTMQILNNIPMINPDVITGVSLFLLFVFMRVSQGYTSVILAHITFCTPYVVLSVMPRLYQLNPNIYEAALDLGATPVQALWKVLVPQLRSGMISGFFLSFTMSLDDFAVTYFTRGTIGLETLSTYIYADARKGGLTPELRPLMTLLFALIFIILIILNLRKTRQKKVVFK